MNQKCARFAHFTNPYQSKVPTYNSNQKCCPKNVRNVFGSKSCTISSAMVTHTKFHCESSLILIIFSIIHLYLHSIYRISALNTQFYYLKKKLCEFWMRRLCKNTMSINCQKISAERPKSKSELNFFGDPTSSTPIYIPSVNGYRLPFIYSAHRMHTLMI